MERFRQRFALLIAGILSGFDRLVFKGRLCGLYWPEGMNCLLHANHVSHKEFKQYAKDNLVLLRCDFPKSTTQPAGLIEQNRNLADMFAIRGYPRMVILNPLGIVRNLVM